MVGVWCGIFIKKKMMMMARILIMKIRHVNVQLTHEDVKRYGIDQNGYASASEAF